MNALNEPTRRIDVAGIASVLAVAAAAWFALAEPLRSSWDEAAAREAKLGDMQSEAAAAEAAAAALADRLDASMRLAEQSSLRARPVSELNARIAELLTSLNTAGLIPGGVEHGSPEPDGAALRVTITVNGEGGYPELTSWLAFLYAEQPDIAPVRIELRRSPRGTAFEVGLVWWASDAIDSTGAAR
jgi:hypothetical protein